MTTKLFKWYLPAIGGLIVFFVFFGLRFLRKRLDGPILLEFSCYKVASYIISITILVFIFLKILGFIKYKNSNKITEAFVNLKKNYDQVIADIYRKIFYEFDFITKSIEYITPKVIRTEYTWCYRLISMFFLLIPYFIVALLFFYDVVIKKEFALFPKYIYLLLIPLVLKISLWFIKEHATIETIAITAIMELSSDPETNTISYAIYPFVWEEKPMLATVVSENIVDIIRQYMNRRSALIVMEQFEGEYNSSIKNKLIKLITILLWLVSWIFMLMYVLQNA